MIGKFYVVKLISKIMGDMVKRDAQT